jgi:hypothetical protein
MLNASPLRILHLKRTVPPGFPCKPACSNHDEVPSQGFPIIAGLRERGIAFLEVNQRTAFPWLSDNQRDGAVMIRIYIWIGLAVVLGGLVLWGWRYQHRRAWSTDKQDESMRRHVNDNYD